MDIDQNVAYRFGPRPRIPLPLSRSAANVLRVLAVKSNEGQAWVTQKEIEELAFVSYSSVGNHIDALRRELGEKTVLNQPNYGYRVDPPAVWFDDEDVRGAANQQPQTEGCQPSPDSPERRALDTAIAAWTDVDFRKLCDFLVEWYRSRGVPLFSYRQSNQASTAVPLYVRPSWVDLREQSLSMNPTGVETAVVLSKDQQEFLDLYAGVREKLGHTPLWNGRLFRLIELHSAAPQLALRFGEGRFFDTLACQYILEHEARLVLAKAESMAIQPGSLPLRESLASTVEDIERFCQTQVVRIGISNLVLLRQDERAYRVLIRGRGANSMGHMGDFDPMTSGMFDIGTANPKIDFSLKYKVFKEIYEELFGGKEVERDIAAVDPYFFYKKPGIVDLRAMLEDGRASFHVTGFCIDLVRIVPEITTVIVVRDESYYGAHSGNMEGNSEYGPSLHCEIPRDLSDVDEYLVTEFPADPARPDVRRGFDPTRWTLAGGFCFERGLKRAAHDKLF